MVGNLFVYIILQNHKKKKLILKSMKYYTELKLFVVVNLDDILTRYHWIKQHSKRKEGY